MSTTSVSASSVAASVPVKTVMIPLQGWALELARKWNGATYSVFVLHGNILDLFPVLDGGVTTFVPLKSFLKRRLFPERECMLYYDVADGLSFGSTEMQSRFFKWLDVYDDVEKTNFHQAGPPKDFIRLAPLLRRFFMAVSDSPKEWSGVTLVIDYAEKLVPASEESGSSQDERMNLVTFLKWASSPELTRLDVGVLLVTETAAKLHTDLLQNPNVAQIKIELPDDQDRLRFFDSANFLEITGGRAVSEWSDFSAQDLAARTSGLNILRVRHLLAEAIRNDIRVTAQYVSKSKQRLIEEFCQGLVRFKDPKPGLNLDAVATHTAAKKRLREIAWLIKNNKTDVLEKGLLLAGRIGVGKSFIIDCFAAECGWPVMEIGEFRSKWVGESERQQMRILLTIKAIRGVVVTIDEADAVLGGADGDSDSGVSARIFAAFAAHIGDSSLRGREFWIAMTKRPDRMAIDMKRQGRFGLCIPLFPAQNQADTADLFTTIARVYRIEISSEVLEFIRVNMTESSLTGSDVESILVRAKEQAVLNGRDSSVTVTDIQDAVNSFIDPLDPDTLELQELAAVLACSDKRYLPDRYLTQPRAEQLARFSTLKARLRAR